MEPLFQSLPEKPVCAWRAFLFLERRWVRPWMSFLKPQEKKRLLIHQQLLPGIAVSGWQMSDIFQR